MNETMNPLVSGDTGGAEHQRLIDESWSCDEIDPDLPRVTDLVLEFGKELSELAETGYRRQGRGAIVFSENLVPSLSAMVPFYLPASDPDLDEIDPEVRQAVDLYDPRMECVVYFVSEAECSYLFLLQSKARRDDCKPLCH